SHGKRCLLGTVSNQPNAGRKHAFHLFGGRGITLLLAEHERNSVPVRPKLCQYLAGFLAVSRDAIPQPLAIEKQVATQLSKPVNRARHLAQISPSSKALTCSPSGVASSPS